VHHHENRNEDDVLASSEQRVDDKNDPRVDVPMDEYR
jgi:hypothetical protein